MLLSDRTKLALEMAQISANILKEVTQGNTPVKKESKGHNDFVTTADKKVEEYIVRTIKEKFPSDSIVSEEGSNLEMKDDKAVGWIIDPLDGTANYYFGYPAYSISIGYKDNVGIAGGVVVQPLLNEVFVAERGKGAYLNEKPIKVNKLEKPSDNIIVMGFSNRKPELWENYAEIYKQVMPQVVDIRRTGSAALDLCYVACGRFGLYYEPAVKVWDIAAGSLIVTEAGGKICDRNGDTIDFCNEDYSILATNGLMNDWIQSYTKED